MKSRGQFSIFGTSHDLFRKSRSDPAARRLVAAALAVGSIAVTAAQVPSSRPRVTGINHVAFRVTDAAAARGFYGEMLGLPERPSSKTGHITYAVGSHQTIVLEPGLPATDDERLSHVAYETTDIDALTAHLKSRGIDVQRPPTRCQETAIRVTDADGHPIEFVQVAWPPPAAKPADTRALSTRILHAGAIVRDEQRAHTFYREALGFREIWRGGRPEGVTRWVNMRVPDGTDYLEYMLVTDPPDRRGRGVMHHLCLRVPDMQAAWEEVARRSVRFKQAMPSPPQIGVNGRYQLNLYDPDGTRVELMEPFTVR
ncbi:MAG: VOC family protein [Vicinamibacterales bacterium]